MIDEPSRRVQSVDRAFAVLTSLKRHDGAGVTELADELDLSVGSTHAYLSTLEANDAVVQREGTYYVGFGLLDYGGYARDNLSFYQLASEKIREVAGQTGELSAVTVEEHGENVYLGVEKGANASNIGIRVGTRLPLHTLASGKAILAALPEGRLQQVLNEQDLEPATENTIVDQDELLGELESVRERGYAVDDEERIEGMRAVASAVTGGDTNHVHGAIVVSGPKTRLRGDRYEQELPTLVRNVSREITINMTHEL